MISTVRFFIGFLCLLIFVSCGPSSSEPTQPSLSDASKSFDIVSYQEVFIPFDSGFILTDVSHPDFSLDEIGMYNYEIRSDGLLIWIGELDGDSTTVLNVNDGNGQSVKINLSFKAVSQEPDAIVKAKRLLENNVVEAVRVQDNDLFSFYRDLSYLTGVPNSELVDFQELAKESQASMLVSLSNKMVDLSDALLDARISKIRIVALEEMVADVEASINALYADTQDQASQLQSANLVGVAPLLPAMSIQWTGASYSLYEGNESLGVYSGDEFVFQSSYSFLKDL